VVKVEELVVPRDEDRNTSGRLAVATEGFRGVVSVVVAMMQSALQDAVLGCNNEDNGQPSVRGPGQVGSAVFAKTQPGRKAGSLPMRLFSSPPRHDSTTVCVMLFIPKKR
jgi:hypothetical protein